MKLHLCCGEVYLSGYTNIDVAVPGSTRLTKGLTPKELADISTTVDNYYKWHFGANPNHGTRFVDGIMNLNHPWPNFNDCEEILIVSSIEHFTQIEANLIFSRALETLKPGGVLKVDFPNLEQTFMGIMDAREETDFDWEMRLLYGSHKDEYSFHKWGYTIDSISRTLYDIGFMRVAEWDEIKHDYPMEGVMATK